MKTLLVGDLHLQAWHILPFVRKMIAETKAQRIVFMGDYVDQWGLNEESEIFFLN